MKILKQWKDTQYKVENTLYEHRSGLKVLHTLNKATVETYLNVLLNQGQIVEKLLEIPQGTAHFLEHILAGNPNKVFKTKAAIDKFEFGTRKRPSIRSNAYTTKKSVAYWGLTNTKGERRLFKATHAIIDYPVENIAKYVDKEKQVILAERSERPKSDRDESYMLKKFLLNYHMPDYVGYVLGEYEDIKSIKADDLKKLLDTYSTNNCIISIQSPKRLNKTALKWIDKIATVHSKRIPFEFKYPKESFRNLYRLGTFNEKNNQGAKIMFMRFSPLEKKLDYHKHMLDYLSRRLISKVGFDELREKHGIIYSILTHRASYLTNEYTVDFHEIGCSTENLKKALEKYYSLITKDVYKFLNSKKGALWLENQISSYIYPRTIEYNYEYNSGISYDILNGFDIYDYEKAKDAVEKITIKQIEQYLKNEVENIPHHLWIVSPLEDKEVEKIVNGSKYHKRWNSTLPR